MKTPTIIKVNDESASERVQSFVVSVTDIQLKVTKHEDHWIASQLVDLQSNTSFNLNILSGTSKASQTAKMSLLEIHESS